MNSTRITTQLEFDCQLIVLSSVSSTNDEVLCRAQAMAQPLTSPLVLVSSQQTAGRGRLGRDWASPSGGVYLSVLLKVEPSGADPEALASLSPLTALALRKALQPLQVAELRLKWPNDLMSQSGKLAGILIEMKQDLAFDQGSAERARFIIVGIGINVKRPNADTVKTAAYLEDDSTQEIPLEDVAAVVINELLRHYKVWQADGFSLRGNVSDYMAHMAQLGQLVSVKNALGNEIACGFVEGIDEQGRLLLSGSSGKQVIAAGEVTLREDV